MSVLSTPKPKANSGRYHWTAEAFYRAVEAGVFDEPNRLELSGGELRAKEPVNPPHANVIESLAERFRELFGATCLVREEKPIHLADDEEPVPDIQIARGTRQQYQRQHPTPDDLLLVVEVTDSTVTRETVEKRAIYGRAGIAEYWVILINQRQVLVFRDRDAQGYMDPLMRVEADTLSPRFAPDVSLSVAEMFAPLNDA